MNFAKFLRTPLFTEHLRWLLNIVYMQKLLTRALSCKISLGIILDVFN